MDSDIEKIHRTPSIRSVSHFEPEQEHNASSSAINIVEPQFEFEENSASSTLFEADQSKFRRAWKHVKNIKGLETRGIEPIPAEERQTKAAASSLQMLLLWFSMSLATNNIIVGSLGTLVFQLSFKDAALCAAFGNILGVLAVGYLSSWGPRSGSRMLIVTRHFTGYYPSKVCCLLNVLTNLGYGMLNSTLGGQILSKVSGGTISVAVGIVVVAASSLVMAIFGMRLFQLYERFSWVPQLMVMCIMLGTAGPRFDFQSPSVGTPGRVQAKRLTFFSLCLSTSLAWAPVAADYYVYYPASFKRRKTFLMTTLGLGHAMILTLLIGIGLGTAVAANPEWAKPYDGTPGGLLMTAFGSLGGFGKFCTLINVLGVIANNTPGAYSMSLNFQMLGDFWSRIPRTVFTVLTTVIYAACAMGGRKSLYEILKNFLPLIGYWVVIWFVIVLEEDLIFRRGMGYDWSAWNDRRRLPVGIAASISFLLGWAGAIAGMDQAYYVGPIAQLIPGGGDLGIWLGASFTAISFLPLRFLEKRKYGR